MGKSAGSSGRNGGVNNSVSATVSQKMEILKMQSYGYPESAIEGYLRKNNIDYVEVYHMTNPESVESIKKQGIKMSYQENRADASYFFADIRDINRTNADILGYGKVGKKVSVVSIRIPRNYASKIEYDSLFNMSFTSSYSAGRIQSNIPSSWIHGVNNF